MKTLISFLLIVSCFFSYSQDTDEPVKVRYNLNGSPENSNPLRGDQNRVFTIKGSPYLNETHQPGSIVNGLKTTKALLRYNAYLDQFQILDEQKAKHFVLRVPNIKIILHEKSYTLLQYEETVRDRALYYLAPSTTTTTKKEGYFELLNSGTTTLYLKTFKRIPKFKLAEHGYERMQVPTFLTVEHYYIKRSNRPAQRIALTKKEVLFALNDKYNEVRSYIKKNKLKIKTVDDVIQVLTYYDSLN